MSLTSINKNARNYLSKALINIFCIVSHIFEYIDV